MSAALSLPASILDLADGMHRDVPAGIYHQRIAGIASKSILDMVERSPSHYEAWLGGQEREPTPALLFGAALHTAVLEPDVYRSTYTVEPRFGDCRRTENKAARDAWRAANAGRLLLEQADADAIAGIERALKTHPLAGKMLRDGASELTLKWVDDETGLVCKARSDYYVEGLGACFDLKTTDDARPHAFRQSVARYRYHVQHGFYSSGFAAVGAPLRHFVFIAVEKVAPYAIAIYSLDSEAVVKGWSAARRNLNTFAQCVESGFFPGYDSSIQTLDLPAWA